MLITENDGKIFQIMFQKCFFTRKKMRNSEQCGLRVNACIAKTSLTSLMIYS